MRTRVAAVLLALLIIGGLASLLLPREAAASRYAIAYNGVSWDCDPPTPGNQCDG